MFGGYQRARHLLISILTLAVVPSIASPRIERGADEQPVCRQRAHQARQPEQRSTFLSTMPSTGR